MTSAQFTVGLAEDSRISSKVLKPPGGGSSDIFGSADENNKQATANRKYGCDSHFTLGGQAEESAGTNGKAASLDAADGASVSSQDASSTSNGTPDNSEPNTPRSGTPLLNGPIAYDNHHPAQLPTPSRPQGRRTQGNPVTGMGYEAEAEKKEETPRRQRVPPGGYSSKLW